MAMAKVEHVKTGKVLTTQQEVPVFITYSVEIYDEESGEVTLEDRIELEGEEYRILDQGNTVV